MVTINRGSNETVHEIRASNQRLNKTVVVKVKIQREHACNLR